MDRFTIDFNLAYDSLAESSCLVVHMPSPVDITRTRHEDSVYIQTIMKLVCALLICALVDRTPPPRSINSQLKTEL